MASANCILFKEFFPISMSKMFSQRYVVTHACNPSTHKAKAGRSEVQDQSGLISEFQGNLDIQQDLASKFFFLFKVFFPQCLIFHTSFFNLLRIYFLCIIQGIQVLFIWITNWSSNTHSAEYSFPSNLQCCIFHRQCFLCLCGGFCGSLIQSVLMPPCLFYYYSFIISLDNFLGKIPILFSSKMLCTFRPFFSPYYFCDQLACPRKNTLVFCWTFFKFRD